MSRFKTYSQKLKDPRWQAKRLIILERDNRTCQICGDKEKTLHIHHKCYHGEPWEVDDIHLITLCCDCHEQEEMELKEYPQLFIQAFRESSFIADDLRELAWGLSELEILSDRKTVAKAYAYALWNKDMQQLIVEKYNEEVARMKSLPKDDLPF